MSVVGPHPKCLETRPSHGGSVPAEVNMGTSLSDTPASRRSHGRTLLCHCEMGCGDNNGPDHLDTFEEVLQ